MATSAAHRHVVARRPVGGAAHIHRRRNRRRRNVPRILLWVAFTVLTIEIAAALFFSPRFWVRQIEVRGNATVPTQLLLDRLAIGPHENLFRLPVAHLRQAVAREPTVASVAIYRKLPGTLEVEVRERRPFVALVDAQGRCFTVDSGFVPFRSGAYPEAGLPLVHLTGTAPIGLGVPLHQPGLDAVPGCLDWAAQTGGFVLDHLEIDRYGKLCLNREGGLPIRLGSSIDLDRKLSTLSYLLEERPGLRAGRDLAYINLYAWDAPALRPAPPAAPNRTPPAARP